MKKKNVLKVFFSVLTVFLALTCTLASIKTKKIKADTVSDLTNTTWIINDEPATLPTGNPFGSYYNDASYDYNINFTSNNINFSTISFVTVEDVRTTMVYSNRDEDITVLSYQYSYSWGPNAYKTVVITGGTDVTDSELIYWFTNNATQQTPTPVGTEITHRYWSPYGIITMSDDDRIGDSSIQYTVLYNEFNNSYEDTVQTGLYFLGVQTNQTPSWSYIESINGSGINILYHGETNNINNAMWLEFNTGDYIDSDLYDLMDLYGYWFDDGNAYIVGMNQGFVEGKAQGRALGQADGVEYTNLITNILNGLGNLLNIQIFPNITLGLILGLPLLLGVFVIIIKILRG